MSGPTVALWYRQVRWSACLYNVFLDMLLREFSNWTKINNHANTMKTACTIRRPACRFANVTGLPSIAIAIRLFFSPQVWFLTFSGMTYIFINVSFMFQPPVFVTAQSRISLVWLLIMVSKLSSEILFISIYFVNMYFKYN